MGFGIAWQKKTKRESVIEELDDDIRVIEIERGDAQRAGSDAESDFKAWASSKHKELDVLRNGWPDFLLKSKLDGKAFGVEVKSENDRLSAEQVACFGVLEAAMVPVYIWSPGTPDKLTPWRSYLKRRPKLRSKANRVNAVDKVSAKNAMRWLKSEERFKAIAARRMPGKR